MVPKVAARGTSFKGAGLYYLHDKKAATAERVAFTHTENLPMNDPDRALDCMAYTALHQAEIKMANGAASAGRKLEKPVYTYSLSWAPDQAPTPQQMINAGRETLKALGLEEHEVLMVAHNDEPHPHLHLIVNRVNPHTGKAAALSNDHLTLSRWAEGYERENGKILCEQRVINNAMRVKGRFVKARPSIGPIAYRQWWKEGFKDASKKLSYVQRATERNLSATHRGEYHALTDKWVREIHALRAELREQNRPQWAALFKKQREEWRALNDMQKTAYLRLRYYLKHRGHQPRWPAPEIPVRTVVREAMRAVLGLDNPHGALSRKHRSQRAGLAFLLAQERREKFRPVWRRYKRDMHRLGASQAREMNELKEKHRLQSRDLARGLHEERGKWQFRKEQGYGLKDEFEARVLTRIERARKRAREERKRGRDRDKDGGRER